MAPAAAPRAEPMLDFNARSYPGGRGYEMWANSVPCDVALPEGTQPDSFDATLQAWCVDCFMITAGRLSAVAVTRTNERIQSDARDTIAVLLALDSPWSGDFDDCRVEVPRGLGCVIDMGQPFATVLPAGAFVMLAVPRVWLETEGQDLAGHHGHVFDGMSGRLLADHLAAVARLLPVALVGELAVVAKSTLTMIRSCLAAAPQKGRSRVTIPLHGRVRSYIDAHLRDENLTPDRIARALSITRSTLYRAVPAMGVAAFIQSRRLEAIHALLYNASETRSFLALAADFGFSSHAHFTTAFRRRFGYLPSDVRRGVRAGGEGAAANRHVRSWVHIVSSAGALCG